MVWNLYRSVENRADFVMFGYFVSEELLAVLLVAVPAAGQGRTIAVDAAPHPEGKFSM